MSNPLKRFGEWKIVSVYNTPAKLASLRNEWTSYVKQGQVFCPSGACPFVPGDKFEYDLENFLYYRARAITGNEVNLNGDMFPHEELKNAYTSFIGKGIYFNHDSADTEKAFGIILDAMYTPVLYENDSYEDKYVEILGAIDRKAIEAKRPGLLKDIESGRVTSTSMGTIAQRAKCSICSNVATNMETLCEHVDPRSPLYMKGRNIFGKACFETNYGLSFIEDSIVYVPADPTAHMLEVYASRTPAYPELGRLADIFAKYSNARGRKLNLSDPTAAEHYKNTGGLIMEKTAATSEFKHTKDNNQHLVAPYQESIKELNEEVADSGAKSLDQKIRRIIEEEIRKYFAPLYEQVDKALRPDIRNKVQQELAKVKTELSDVLPGAAQAIADAPLPKGEEAMKPAAPAAPEAAPKASALLYTEDFSTWNDADKQKLIHAVTNKNTYEFKGILESQDPSEEGN
jgi:hypothetical protein